MSYLENQLSAFKSNLTSSSQKIANKRTATAPGVSGPVSPAPSHTSITSRTDLKRKRPETSDVVYSQPANTGMGQNIMTQVTFAIDHLKRQKEPISLEDLLGYLSLQHSSVQYKRSIASVFQNHPKIEYDRDGCGGKGAYTFRPFLDIRSGEQLIGYLQSQRTAQGLSARELRDGWPAAEETIRKLEKQGQLLVTRNKKDDQAKMIWPNDPTLSVRVDEEFKNIWHKIKLPDPADVANELEKLGLTPTNKARGIKPKPKAVEKKTKKPRRSGKTTNLHMQGVLRDYSTFKK